MPTIFLKYFDLKFLREKYPQVDTKIDEGEWREEQTEVWYHYSHFHNKVCFEPAFNIQTFHHQFLICPLNRNFTLLTYASLDHVDKYLVVSTFGLLNAF